MELHTSPVELQTDIFRRKVRPVIVLFKKLADDRRGITSVEFGIIAALISFATAQALPLISIF